MPVQERITALADAVVEVVGERTSVGNAGLQACAQCAALCAVLCAVMWQRQQHQHGH